MKIIMRRRIIIEGFMRSFYFVRQTAGLPATEQALIEMTLRVVRTSPRPAVSRPPAHDALPTEARSAQPALGRL